MARDELRERFKKFPPEVQAAVKRAFRGVRDDLQNTESRTAKSIQAIEAFAQDSKKGRRQLEDAIIEDPVLRKTVCDVIRESRKKQRAAQRKDGVQVVDPRRDALDTRRSGRNRR